MDANAEKSRFEVDYNSGRSTQFKNFCFYRYLSFDYKSEAVRSEERQELELGDVLCFLRLLDCGLAREVELCLAV